MGRHKKEVTEEVSFEPTLASEEPKEPECSNLENNIHALEEMRVFVDKYPDMKLGQLLYNIVPQDCITMGDLINIDAKTILEIMKVIRRKKLKSEVAYGS